MTQMTFACLTWTLLVAAAAGPAGAAGAADAAKGPRVPRVTEMRAIRGQAQEIARLAMAAHRSAEQWSSGGETDQRSLGRQLLELQRQASRLAKQAERDHDQPEKTRNPFASLLRAYCATGDRLFGLSTEGSVHVGTLPPHLGDTLYQFDAVSGIMRELMFAYGYDGCSTYSHTSWNGRPLTEPVR